MRSVNSNSDPSESCEPPEAVNFGVAVKVRQFIANQDKLYGITHKANVYYLTVYKSHSNLKIPQSLFAAYKASQACWLQCMAAAKQRDYLAMGFNSMDEFYAVCISLMKEEKWPGWKLNSVAELRKRLTNFIKALRGRTTFIKAYESQLNKRAENENAQKLGLEQRAFIVTARIKNDVSYEELLELYKVRAARMIELGFWSKAESRCSLPGLYATLNKPEVKKLWVTKKKSGGVEKL